MKDTNPKKLSLNKLTVASFMTELEQGEKGRIIGGIPGIDIPTWNDFSCAHNGGCDSSRCSEVDKCHTDCSGCYTERLC